MKAYMRNKWFWIVLISVLVVGFVIGFFMGEKIYSYAVKPFSNVDGELDLSIFWSAIVGLATVFLAVVALIQNNRANTVNKSLYELEWKRSQPCFNITNGQKYKIYLGEAINKYKEENNYLFDCLSTEFLYCSTPRSGITTSIALLEIEITNSGFSDIRAMYIKELIFHLCSSNPSEQIINMGFLGNQEIKTQEKRILVIDVKQELTDNEETKQQIAWLKSKNAMPYMEVQLHIISSNGYEYDEKITLSSGWHVPMVREGNTPERILQVMDIETTGYS